MAGNTFLNSVEARNAARNNTTVWTEINEIESQILSAIDNDQYSVIVNDGTPMTTVQGIDSVTVTNGGTNYDIVEATATINANGTGGVNASVTPIVEGQTITGFTVDNGGSGYAPVSVTASVTDPSDLNDGQDETDYDEASGDGTFTAGTQYIIGETITLDENSTVTVDAIGASTGVVTVDAQDETDFDGVGSNGTFVGGNGSAGSADYQASDTITLSDGTVIMVDSTVNGDVTEFTVSSTSTGPVASGSTLTQISTSGSGGGFALTLGTNNEIQVGPITEFTVSSPATSPFFWPATLKQSSTTGIGTGFTLVPGANNITTITGGTGADLTPLETNGVITDVIINTPGTGYLVGAPIVFTHPSGTGAKATVSAVGGSGEILAITVTNGGSGYGTVTAIVTVDHPTGFGFEGTVQTNGGVVTGVSIQDGGSLFGPLSPTATVSDPTGTGAELSVNIGASSVTSIDIVSKGSGYTNPTVSIEAAETDDGSGATAVATAESNTFGTTPSDYFDVQLGQATDAVIQDQIQSVLDYFDALGYNIRVQTNPSTNTTLQWQVIW